MAAVLQLAYARPEISRDDHSGRDGQFPGQGAENAASPPCGVDRSERRGSSGDRFSLPLSPSQDHVEASLTGDRSSRSYMVVHRRACHTAHSGTGEFSWATASLSLTTNLVPEKGCAAFSRRGATNRMRRRPPTRRSPGSKETLPPPSSPTSSCPVSTASSSSGD